MDFSRNINNFRRFTGGVEGNALMWYAFFGIVILIAIFIAMWQYEFFGCLNSRINIDGKCVNKCPEGYTYWNDDKLDEKKVMCSNNGFIGINFLKPTPTPVPTAAPLKK